MKRGRKSASIGSVSYTHLDVYKRQFLQDVLDLWKDGREVRAEDLQRHRLATIACHHSIRFNRVLSIGEMQEVIEQLAHCEQPYHCPHGLSLIHI